MAYKIITWVLFNMIQLTPYRRFHHFLLICSGLFFVSACTINPQTDHRASPEAAVSRLEKPEVHAKTTMISVANPLAARAGQRILRAGGSAIDAAIAAQLVLNLVEPQSSGIGGGGFLVLYDPQEKRILTFDGRETAPLTAESDQFLHEDGHTLKFFEAAVGGLSVGTPGLVQLMADAHAKYGRLDWATLFEDAIHLAETGFPVSERLHGLIAQDKHLKNDPTARAYFYLEDGRPLPVAHLLKNPTLADTLRQIQKGGADAFYHGELAGRIIAKVQNHPTNPGKLDRPDFENYRTVQRAPVCLDYKTYTICGMPPPSSGGLSVLGILGIMDQYDQTHPHETAINRTHLYLEASKLAFADRNFYIADPDFIPVPTQALLAPSYLRSRAALIQSDQALIPPVAAGNPLQTMTQRASHSKDHGLSTTHMSLVDNTGMMVSLTTSIENAFGSRQMVGGFLLNNQLTDFSFTPSKNGKPIANRLEGGKRPRSSMAPTIVRDKNTGQPLLAIGSPGGSRIIGYVAQKILAITEGGLALDHALAQGHITNRNGTTDLEKGTDAIQQKATLEKLGHKISIRDMTSGLHVVQIKPDGSLVGAADPRREGIVLGD